MTPSESLYTKATTRMFSLTQLSSSSTLKLLLLKLHTSKMARSLAPRSFKMAAASWNCWNTKSNSHAAQKSLCSMMNQSKRNSCLGIFHIPTLSLIWRSCKSRRLMGSSSKSHRRLVRRQSSSTKNSGADMLYLARFGRTRSRRRCGSQTCAFRSPTMIGKTVYRRQARAAQLLPLYLNKPFASGGGDRARAPRRRHSFKIQTCLVCN